MKFNIDCKYYLGCKPCQFHKQDGRLCQNCPDYQKIENRILIIKLDALGDVLRTTSILPALFAKFKNSQITWITRKAALDLLKNNPYINNLLAVEENYLEFVLSCKFDLGINLDADALSCGILALADCRQKAGFLTNRFGQMIPANKEASNWYYMGLNDSLKKENRKTYQEIIYEICQLDLPVHRPQITFDNQLRIFAQVFCSKNKLSSFNKIVGLNTGAGKRWPLKKWILDNYIKLIKLLKNFDNNIGIILFGGPEEVEFNQKIKKRVPDLIIDAGCHNSILQFSVLIDMVDVFVTPDSLGMQISIALSKKVLVLVGPTSPWELDVFGNGEIIFNHDLECIACYRSTCDKEINCMNSIEPEMILKILKKHL